MINSIYPNDEVLKDMPLKERLINQLYEFKAEYLYDTSVMFILEKKNPLIKLFPSKKYKFHKEEAQRDLGAIIALELVYRTEFGNDTDIFDNIASASRLYADKALERKGYKKTA